jgi:type II secretory pathway pseudopilin PulG
MHHHVRGQRAFTILEVIISVGIFALLAIAMVDLIVGTDGFLRTQQVTVDVIGSASEAMNDIQTLTTQATQVVTSHTFSGTTYTTSTSTLVLQLPAITSGGSTINGIYDYVTYYATGTSAYRIIDPGVGSARPAGTKRLSDAITSFTFTFGSVDPTASTSTVIDIQTQGTFKKINASTHLHEQVYLRNSFF